MPLLGWTALGSACIAFQLALAVRVVARMIASARGTRIAPCADDQCQRCVSIVVPVLDEESRLAPCLDALRMQGACVREILVVDGGSRDATRSIVLAAAALDPRVRLIEAPELPPGWNGKAWNLETGLRASDAESRFVLTIDADVRASSQLVSALVAHASATGVDAFSVATSQHVADALGGLVHPSMLATLVYRFGIPGRPETSVARVQANGQCFFAVRERLVATDAIAASRDSRCEDVTIARALAAGGTAVGFYESASLARVQMYETGRETLQNWPRSLPMLDRFSGVSGWIGLLEVLFVQALPPWIAAGLLLAGAGTPFERVALEVQVVLVVMRLATMLGTRRAYEAPPLTYWFSPLADLPVAVLLVASALRRRHMWRGRVLVASAAR